MTASTCHPDRPIFARDLCSACYQREWKAGTLFGRPKRVRRQPTQEQKRRSHLKQYYNLTVEQYDSLLAVQGGACAVCAKEFGDETPSVDHDHTCCSGSHSCGKCVRGILHKRCNTLLRWAQDDPSFLMGGVTYLHRRPHDAQVVVDGHPPAARNTVAVDFDATLYPFGDLFGMGPPLPGAVDGMRLLRGAGFRIVIFTSRLSEYWLNSEDRSLAEQESYIAMRLDRDGIPWDEMTADKRPCLVYFDDRASTVSPERDLLDAVIDFLRSEGKEVSIGSEAA